ncbi:antibiotic biosynthesis monooxygenase [Vibrio paucivorans]|uniref:Antibiotic biosynthesis monooxygenase n=1 Tax=Vibrio paucivorans TaxID=2829489 RepID=A0A9X3CIC2_9VIBR|nr:antibiotic biosynthesis monooxygenase [Vibrio paucivorans]MCW8336383.1 antibiotic biosynthesis monooxygenase [Vibrio paucivorans]
MSTIEIVKIRVFDHVTERDFIEANQQVCAFANTQPGFKQRLLSKSDAEHEWIVIAEWESERAAKQAKAAFAQSPQCDALKTMMDPSKSQVFYSDIVLKVPAQES